MTAAPPQPRIGAHPGTRSDTGGPQGRPVRTRGWWGRSRQRFQSPCDWNAGGGGRARNHESPRPPFAWRYGRRLTRRILSLCLGLTVIVALAIAALTWRLSLRPLESPWLTAQVRAELARTAPSAQVTLGQAGIFWEGFSAGLESPIDLRLHELSIRRADGSRIQIPDARVSLAVLPLLQGRFEPRTVTLDHPHFDLPPAHSATPTPVVIPAESLPPRNRGEGTHPVIKNLSAISAPAHLIATLLRRPALHALAHLRIQDGTADLDPNWYARHLDLDAVRSPAQGVTVIASLDLQTGNTAVPIHANLILPPDLAEATLAISFTSLRPTALAKTSPALAMLGAFDALVDGHATINDRPEGDRAGGPTVDLQLTAGPGSIHLMGASLPLTAASLHASGTLDTIALETARLTLQPPSSDTPTTFALSGTIHRTPGQNSADLTLDLDRLRFADLPALWPQRLAQDARAWITENITDGTAHNGHASLQLTTNDDLTKVQLHRITATLPASGLTVHWLRPVPAVVNGQAILRITNPNALEIDIASGQQTPNGRDAPPLAIDSGTVRITGLDQPDQNASVDLHLNGAIPTVLGLLSHPRMDLLSRAKMAVRNADGRLDGKLKVTLPLIAELRLDQIGITTQDHLSGMRLPDVLAGQTLSQGDFELTANNDTMRLQGHGVLGTIPADITADRDFRAGPVNQDIETITLRGRPTTAQLAAAGFSAGDWISGILPLTASLTERRNGTGTLKAQVNLQDATLRVEPLAWDKPVGTPATASFTLTLTRDRPQALDAIDITGPNLLLQGNATFQNGHLSQIHAERVTLGRTRAQASITLGQGIIPTSATLSGSSLDLSRRLTPPSHPTRHARPERGPPWQMDARFDRVILAHDQELSGVAFHAVNDGERFRDFRLQALTAPSQPVLAVITPDRKGRTLRVTAANGGALLRGFDLLNTVDGGRLSISGRYQDDRSPALLSGIIDMEDFSVRNGAALGKLLQSLTVYGLIDAMRGPGVQFSRLIAPFHYVGDVLELTEARAFSASLGLTAKGSIDFDASTINLQGTVVPAYFFNSLLGRVPILGKLFSPEQGGGLIAASYGLSGSLDNPAVAVNPLTALTPGFLRGLLQH